MSRQSPFFEQIKANVDRCGLHVFGTAGDENNPTFTYTVGFARLGLPEVICFGLNSRMVTPFLNRYYHEIANGLRDAGPAVLEGEDWFNLPMSVINIERQRAVEYAVQADLFAQDMSWSQPEFVQWVWPDEAGRLPWQTGFNHQQFSKVQPILARFAS